MADFKKALSAVARGKLKEKIFSRNLEKLLRQSPRDTSDVLEELDEAHTTNILSKDMYSRLRNQVERVAEETGAMPPRGLEVGADSLGDTQVMGAVVNLGGDRGTAEQTTGPPGTEAAGTAVDLDLGDIEASAAPPTAAAPTGWTEASGEAGGDSPLDIGSVIKHRFKLLEVLGEGGMGKVFKGIDLLKQEARDRHPYVAIKLLNEDFKQHPEAFISLQRESSRQQKLAHPNIATVYDFDRIGTSGSQVYLTMELLEGQPLNVFIKEKARVEHGLSFEQVYPMIQGLGHALAYAHNRNIVHSDFKPGNSFLCKDGNMKVLDFGIARAAKNPLTGDSEKTLFDPGKLGALTPAYASLEMLEGEEPDPRDDIYALGCVSYELLTGRHPFNKMPATVALENNLVPHTVKGLKTRQNRALRRSVAFHREDRSPTVEDFLEDLEGKANWHKNPFVLTAAALALIAGIGFFPLKQHLHREEIKETIFQIQQSREYTGEVLTRLDDYAASDRSQILDGARTAILKYYKAEIDYAIQTDEGRYNFRQAQSLLDDASALYPDSTSLKTLDEKIQNRKGTLLYGLNKRYIELLENKTGLLASQGQIDEVLNRIEEIEPEHPLLQDRRLENAYREVAADELGNKRYQKALDNVLSGLEQAPDNPQLLDLKTRIERELRVAMLEENLRAALPELQDLADYPPFEKNIIELTLKSPGSALIAELTLKTRGLLRRTLNEIRSGGTREDAERTAKQFGRLLSALQFGRELSELKLAHLSGPQRQQVIQEILGESRNLIDSLLQAPQLGDPDWQGELRAALQQVEALLPANDPFLPETHKRIASLHIIESDKLLKEQRFEDAISLLQNGTQLAPTKVALLQSKEQDVQNAQAELQRQAEEEERLASLEIDKDSLRTALNAKSDESVAEARKIFARLKTGLPADDPFLVKQAPGLFEKAYLSLARELAGRKDYKDALRKVRAGLKEKPDSVELKSLELKYRIEETVLELGQTFRDKSEFTDRGITNALSFLQRESPERYKSVYNAAVEILRQRIQALAVTQPEQSRSLADQSLLAFPSDRDLMELRDSLVIQPWEGKDKAEQAIAGGRLLEARGLLEQAPGDHPEADPFRARLEKKEQQANALFDTFQQLSQQAGSDRQKLQQAEQPLLQARGLWKDNPAFEQAKQELTNRIAGARAARGPRRREEDAFGEPAAEPRPAPAEPAPTTPASRNQDQPSSSPQAGGESPAAQGAGPGLANLPDSTPSPPPAPLAWQPIASPEECTRRLSGYGKRARAACYDMVSPRHRGPELVVVPAGEYFQKPFAIGKYEISVNDYNKFCAFSQSCPGIRGRDKNYPLTGISLREVDRYLEWLSERTGKSYRLPTPEEWTYAAAATAAGMTAAQEREVRSNLNCEVVLESQVIKGLEAISVRSGQPNGWGLRNYLGNVQELVRGTGDVRVRGGSHKDSLADCTISLSRAYDGAASPVTGFRVVREEVY